MPRPKKCRKICQLPKTSEFVPVGHSRKTTKAVVLTVDEYEAVRLIDKEGFSQLQCGKQMNIARTTVQQIYACARRKIAESLVCGLPLKIEGGDYQTCNGQEEHCRCGGCEHHRKISHKSVQQ